MNRLLTVIAALALCGCPAEPLPGGPGPVPDAGRDGGTDGLRPDAAPTDFRVRDVEPPEPDQDLDRGPPPDAAPPDALPFDLPDPAIPPALADTAVLVGRIDTWVGWVIGDRLYAARIDTLGDEDDGADAGPAPTIERARPIAELPGFGGGLVGVRSPNGRPWVLIADGDDGMLRAHDLSGALTPRPLGLWPPARVAISGEEILLVARSGAAEDAPIASVRLTDAGPRAPVLDTRGIALPASVSPGFAGWVYAFDDGICQMRLPSADPAVDPRPGEFWRCAARRDVLTFGDGRRLFAVGPIGPHLRTWTLMPGAARTPSEDPAVDDPREFTIALDASAEPLHPIPGGWALRVETLDGVEIHLITADEMRVMAAPADGVLLGVTRAFDTRYQVMWDPALGLPTLRAAEAAAGPSPPIDALDCRPLPELCDAYDNYIDLDCVDGRENARCCRERATGDVEVTTLDLASDQAGLADVPTLPYFLTRTPVGPVMIVSYGDRLDLLRFAFGSPQDNEAEGVRIARFDGVERIERFAQNQSRLVVHGVRSTPIPPAPPADDEPDLGPPDVDAGPDAGPDADPDAGPDLGPPEPEGPIDVLLWYLGRQTLLDGTERVLVYETPTPCAPILGLTLREEYVRVYCPETALDAPVDTRGPRFDEAVEVPYPTAPVRWIGPSLLDGTTRDFLAATGDAHVLHHWQDTADGEPIVDLPLPTLLTHMQAPDRTLPIRLPESDAVQPARLVGARLEVYIDDTGWRPAPSSRWPSLADFSSTDPLAVTLAEITNPTAPGYNPSNRRYVVHLHDLRTDALHWGQPMTMSADPLETETELIGRFVFGMRFADYDAGNPLLWYGYGDPRNITLLARGVYCNPAIPPPAP